ncbi:MAG: hypothetical protein AAB414_05550 [Patescibacteria group bacterium]
MPWKNRRFQVIAILIVILLPILIAYLLTKTPLKDQVTHKLSNDEIAASKASYKLTKNPNGSTDYFIKGTIQKITDQPHLRYLVEMQLTPASASGTLIQFTIPWYPPRKDSAKYGKSIKEMFEKGFKEVDIKIEYDKESRFWGWEVLNNKP